MVVGLGKRKVVKWAQDAIGAGLIVKPRGPVCCSNQGIVGHLPEMLPSAIVVSARRSASQEARSDRRCTSINKSNQAGTQTWQQNERDELNIVGSISGRSCGCRPGDRSNRHR